ncbi:MAG: hypothetical protein HY782_15900 [Chloroflexi bacterium]|nr:hypothetical protein [Chloroflexota bacterium]
MRKLVALVSLAILVSGCAAAPTGVRPTAAPQPTARPPATAPSGTPEPTPNPITVKNVQTQKQPSGEIRTTAQVSTQDNLGLGQIEVYSPDRMALGETTAIRLRISPAPQLASSTPVAAPAGKTPGLPSFVYRFSGNIQIYPLMIAELRAITFAINPPGPQQRQMAATTPVEWSWLANSKTGGRQALGIELSIPAIVNGVSADLSTSVLQDIPIIIEVDAPATQTPAPDFWSDVAKSIANNSGAILIALIGLAGTVIGLLVKARSDAQQPKKPKK